MSDQKIKVALIDARLNSGQVNMILPNRSNNTSHIILIILKGKDGTQLGPKYLKTSYLIDNLKNLGIVTIVVTTSKFHI